MQRLCPKCGDFKPVTVTVLETGTKLTCSGCGEFPQWDARRVARAAQPDSRQNDQQAHHDEDDTDEARS